MITVTYHDDLKEVQADPVLAAMLSAPYARAPFDRLEWWRLLEKHCGLPPLVAVARDGDHRAVLALLRKGRDIQALANWYSFNISPLFSEGADRQALLSALANSLAGAAQRIVLSPLPDEGEERLLLANALRTADWIQFATQCDINHVLPVSYANYQDYLASRPGPLRTTLKRKAGKVAVTIETHFNPDSWAAYEAIYAQSWKPEEGSPAFLRAFAEAEGKAGRIRLGIARAEGIAVAAQFWTVEHGTAFIHKLAHTEDSKPLSPGTTLSAALFEHVIDHDKVGLVDFGTGDNPYKRDWMDTVRPRYRIEAFRARYPRNWPLIIKRLLKRHTEI